MLFIREGRFASRTLGRRKKKQNEKKSTKRRVIRYEERSPIILVEVKGEKTLLIPFRCLIVYFILPPLSRTHTHRPSDLLPSPSPAHDDSVVHMSDLIATGRELRYCHGLMVSDIGGRSPELEGSAKGTNRALICGQVFFFFLLRDYRVHHTARPVV